jgi:hypothetical protein
LIDPVSAVTGWSQALLLYLDVIIVTVDLIAALSAVIYKSYKIRPCISKMTNVMPTLFITSMKGATGVTSTIQLLVDRGLVVLIPRV